MDWLYVVSESLLDLYRERNGSPKFWAEPLNAWSNLSFVIAAAAALLLAMKQQLLRHGLQTWWLIGLAASIGVGSFVFHTVPNHVTMWLDIVPIALFQASCLWLLSRRALSFSAASAAGVVMGVMVFSFMLLPVEALNGSLFYLPSLIALSVLAIYWVERASREPYLLILAVGCFAAAIVARTSDWHSFSFGSHFIWHLLNGGVAYLGLRTWLVYCATLSEGVRPSSLTPPPNVSAVADQ